MYCKQCGKEYQGKEKLCKKCGIALTPGRSPNPKKGVNKWVIIAVVAIAAALVAVFLVIGLRDMVPSALAGVWYDEQGVGPRFEFKPEHVLEYSSPAFNGAGSYEFDASTGEGMLYTDIDSFEAAEFTCDGKTLEWGGLIFTHAYTDQVDLTETIKDMMDELTKTQDD